MSCPSAMTMLLWLLGCLAVAKEQEVHGQLVCFRYCPILKRDFAVLLSAQHAEHDRQQADVLEKQHQQADSSGSHGANSSATKVSSTCRRSGCVQASHLLTHHLSRTWGRAAINPNEQHYWQPLSMLTATAA